MAAKFGTSGLRGLVSELSADLVGDYTRAFLAACPVGTGLFLGQDLRESSPEIAAAVAAAAQAEGVAVFDCGVLPTPALALAAGAAGAAAIMVTGSHIPADRNGLKFYTPMGEISKAEETAISAALGRPSQGLAAEIQPAPEAHRAYIQRYSNAFGPKALAGLRIGVWQHSSTARDVLTEVLTLCGAEVVPLGRSAEFIPVDTEAVDPQTRGQLADWCAHDALDALVSTDGDADRPMLADQSGQIIPGDILGMITAQVLGAKVLVTPVSSNSGAELMGEFSVKRTKIGSPYVIEEMTKSRATSPGARVVGYEANGGFLLGYAAEAPAGGLAPLMTRDSLLPILAPLYAAAAQRISVAQLASKLPPRFTASDRLQGVTPEAATALLAKVSHDPAPLLSVLGLGQIASRDQTDGLRLIDSAGKILHLRPSGNAPEFRVYIEAASQQRAQLLLQNALRVLPGLLI